MADTLREFIVSFGFKLDESQQRNFVGALEGATLRANLLATAIEDMARTVVDKVAAVATQFEQLFYQSQRVGASASSIRAFEYAVSQLGGSVESANSSLNTFGAYINSLPKVKEALANNLGIPLQDAADTAKFFLEVTERLTRMPTAQAQRYVETYHLGDPSTTFSDIQDRNAAHDRALKELEFYNEQKNRDSASGIGGDAMKHATEFEQAWRGVWARIGTMAEGGESKLLAALTNPMQKFGDWLDKNSPEINDAISRMATSIGSLTTAWVDDLAKVKWDTVATQIDNAATSIANLTDAIVKDLPVLQALLGALVGSRIGAPFGPIGAAIGAGAGALAPSVIESGGIGGWWKSHAPNWLGGNSGGGLSQNGAPISESNPLAVNIVRADAAATGGDGGGGGFLSGLWGGVKHALGFGGGAPAGVRARGSGGDTSPSSFSDFSHLSSGDERMKYSRGVQNFNPGNIMWGSWAAAHGATGGHGTDQDHQVAVFPDYATGIKAMQTLALSKYNSGRKSAEGLIAGPGGWTPGNSAAAANVARAMGLGPGDDLRLNDPEFMRKFVGGLTTQEVGPAGARYIFGGRPTTSPRLPARPASGLPASAPLNWDTGPVWDRFNSQLPTGPSGGTDSSKSITSSVTNNITVSGSDPQSTAAMVGVHLDRSSNDISRNLQGAFQ